MHVAPRHFSAVMALALLVATAPTSAQRSDRGVPAAPNYANPDTWAAWPGRPSGADAVPSDAHQANQQAVARVDVFFVHPTTFLSLRVGNAAHDAGGIARLVVDETVLRYQAGAFNGCCRIYAPHCRQASIGSFLKYGADSIAAIDLAYSDSARVRVLSRA